MMSLQKTKPWRSARYLKWVRSQPCVFSGQTEDITAHHIISCGLGGVAGDKLSDLFAIPLHMKCHARLHSPEGLNIDQKAEALKMIDKAVREGVLVLR